MKKITPLLLLPFMMLSLNTQAYIFQGDIYSSAYSEESDVEFTYYDEKYKFDTETDIDTTGLALTFYFGNVPVDQVPWDQAAFLDKASGISIAFDSYEYDYKDDGGSFDQEYDAESVAVRGVIGSFILEGALMALERDNSDYEESGISIGLGGYLDDHQEIVFTYEKNEVDTGVNTYDPATIDFRYKNVFAVGSQMHMAVGGSLELTDHDTPRDEKDTILTFNAAFYPRDNLGVQASLSTLFKDENDIDVYVESIFQVGISYYPVEQVHLTAGLISVSGYSEYEEGNLDLEVEEEWSGLGLNLGFGVRF